MSRAEAARIIGATGAAIIANATANNGQLNAAGRTILTASAPSGSVRSASAMKT